MRTRLTIIVSIALCISHGHAQADAPPPLPDVAPMPPNGNYKMPTDAKAADELRKALAASNQDVNALLLALQKSGCNDDAVKALCAKHPDLPACKQILTPKVVTPPPTKTTTRRRPPAKKPEPPKTTPKKVDPAPGKDGANAYLEFERFTDDPTRPNACVRLTAWTDKNRNGKRDDGEAKGKTEKVCNGKDGFTSHIDTERFTKDAKCPNAGVRITTWLDKNRDGKMDKVEISSTDSVCDGRDGKDAVLPKAHDGRDGRPGRDGTTISAGLLFTGDLIRSPNAPEIRSSAFGIMLNLERSWAEVTVAGAWSPGIDHGTVLSADFAAYPLWNRLGPRIGAQLIYAGIDKHNQASYQVLMATPGIALRILDDRHWKVRAEAHVGVGKQGTYSRFHDAYSVGGSLSLMYGF